MKIQYLGTAACEGWPALFCRCEACGQARQLGGKNIRTRSQSLVDDCLLLDMPADTYYHSLKYNIDLSAIEHILITHSHDDHFYPLDILMKTEPYAFMGKVKKINVYGNNVVSDMLKKAMNASGTENVFDYINPVEVKSFEPFEAGEYVVTALTADHMSTEEAFIYIIERNGKRMLYAHDTGVFPEVTMEYISKLHFDFVSLDCTFGVRCFEHGHMGLPNNIAIKKGMMESGCADGKTVFVINHFSHNGRALHDTLEKEASKSGFITSYDGLTINF
ncbi:MAG TPA: MBL fold metallo-hydrolase [Ruminiclostridium sp.]|nr:MBL fold metallo-hydrolase [Ruminiclostridium sp.]